ncbi:MAG: phosphonate ABC transporter, permease protein PhnE [Labrys sp. (in: a-proteobacteria)]|jgi:phosphonate transport system permease protein
MSGSILSLPPDRLRDLDRAYADAVAAKRRQVLIGGVVLIVCIIVAGFVSEVRPLTFIENVSRFFSYLGRIFTLESGASVFTDPGEWFWGLNKWLVLLWQTIVIAYVGTLLGALAGFTLCFLAAANLVSNPWIRLTTKRFLEFCRTVPELVFALIFVASFGLGPLAGVLAIAIHTTGALGKMFSEVVENIDMKPAEGVTASGGSWIQMVRFAVVPQVLSNFASYGLLRFEINVRGAAVMGFVGAGGIGQDLMEAIRKFYYSDVSALLLMIILTVMIIDQLTERLRHSLLGLEAR